MQLTSSYADFGWYDLESSHGSTRSNSEDSFSLENVLPAELLSNPSSSSSSPSWNDHHLRPRRKNSLANGTILFTFDNIISSLSCRSFEDLTVYEENTQIGISVQSFRIVQHKEGILAEFKVVMIVNDQEFSCWKRFSEFSKLADSCGIPTGPLRFIHQSPVELSKSTLLWNRIEKMKPWFRSTSIRYLVWKTCKLEEFLKNLLFEVMSPQILIDFMRGWDGALPSKK